MHMDSINAQKFWLVELCRMPLLILGEYVLRASAIDHIYFIAKNQIQVDTIMYAIELISS